MIPRRPSRHPGWVRASHALGQQTPTEEQISHAVALGIVRGVVGLAILPFRLVGAIFDDVVTAIVWYAVICTLGLALPMVLYSLLIYGRGAFTGGGDQDGLVFVLLIAFSLIWLVLQAVKHLGRWHDEAVDEEGYHDYHD